MVELTRHETSPEDCLRFDRFLQNEWNPPIFRWAITGTSPAMVRANEEQYRALQTSGMQISCRGTARRKHTCALGMWLSEHDFARAARDASPYPFNPRLSKVELRQQTHQVYASVPPGVRGPCPRKHIAPNETADCTTLRSESVQMAHQLRSVMISTGLGLTGLTSLVEFGAGTGALSMLVDSLQLRTSHLIIDLPPMLLLQRYFLNRAALPSYYVGYDVTVEEAILAKEQGELRGRRALIPVTNLSALTLISARAPPANPRTPPHPRTPAAHTNGTHSADAAEGSWSCHPECMAALPRPPSRPPSTDNSLFIATWSFTEASISAREAVRPHLRGFGRLYLVFWQTFDGISNWYVGC